MSPARHTASVGAHPPQDERDRPRCAHLERLDPVALEADVVTEPLRLLGCVCVAVDVHHQAEVIGGLQLAVAGPGEFPEPQCYHRLPHAVRHRLPEPEIGGIGQRCHEFRDPDITACLRPSNHDRSLRSAR